MSLIRRATPEHPVPAKPETDPFRWLFRWDPFREMAAYPSAEPTAYAPAFEVMETKDAFVFKADLPGVKESDTEVNLVGGRLTMSGKRESEREDKGETYYAFERSYGNFTRTFTLPSEIDAAHVKAELKNGELTVVVPKAPAAVAKRIPVSGGDKPKT